MSIFRVNKDKENPYVMINKRIFEDKNISYKSKGLLCHLLSLPDDWQIYESELLEHTKDGRDSIKSAIKELINNGYIERSRKRDEKGMLREYEYNVYEQPIQNGKTNVGKTNVGKSVTTNNNNTNNNNTNINTKSKDLEEVVNKYNSIPELSNVVKVTDKRKKALNARIKDTSIEDVFKVLDVVASSDFLRGYNNRNWKCDFDWIMNPNNFIKILEGKYGVVKEVKKDTPRHQDKALESNLSDDIFKIEIDY